MRFIVLMVATVSMFAHATIAHHHHLHDVCFGADQTEVCHSSDSSSSRGDSCPNSGKECGARQLFTVPSLNDNSSVLAHLTSECDHSHHLNIILLACSNCGVLSMSEKASEFIFTPLLLPNPAALLPLTVGLRAPPVLVG